MGDVAAAAAGDDYLGAQLASAVEHEDSVRPGAPRVDRCHEAGRTRSDHDDFRALTHGPKHGTGTDDSASPQTKKPAPGPVARKNSNQCGYLLMTMRVVMTSSSRMTR
jgi:hypothetical protein